ncbi:MAG: site-specific integrase [Acidobacteria bacterium]|nr:site-specific integrase [Acidobacteriota bacterium]
MAGWIRKLGSGRYQARYRTPDGRTRARTWDRCVDAKRWLRQELARIDHGGWVDPSAGTVTFEDWTARWAESRLHLRDSTRERDDTYLRSLVLPHFGSRQLRGVTPADVQSWIAKLSRDGYAAATVQLAYGLLSMSFAAAVEAGLLARSPCRGVKLPKRSQREMRFLSIAELHVLADVIDPRFRVLILTAGLTGARFGELAALRIGDLNLLRRRLTITRSLTEVRGELRETEPKTTAARRTIALPASLVDDLARHLAAPSRDATDRVFTSPEGGPLRRRSFRQRFWIPAVKASVGEPCRFHDLRHTHGALLIAVNTHPKLLQTRLGHSSIKTTLDIYGHLYEPLDEEAADRLEELVLGAIAHETRTERASGL